MQDQMRMTGIDTELSQVADKYLEAVIQLKSVEQLTQERRKDLIKVIKKVNKTNFIHNGIRIIFRSGHITDSTVVVKNV